ncbi:MAG TPA: prepilin peptidase [Rhizomicrobium sp.]|nr:prepilin peptidase [Rhizomicrobium sp.]
MAEILTFIPLLVLLMLAGGWDLASFTIPNFIQAGLILSFIAFALVSGFTLPVAAGHLLAGFVGLAAGFTLFALGYIGGGDAKLFACVSLWLGFHDLPLYALAAAVLGGALTIAIIGVRRFPLPANLAKAPWIARLHDAKSGIPYGVALAAGLIAILPQTEIFRLASGG